MYEVNFPLTEIKIRHKNLKTPWFSKGLQKSSKTKQILYIRLKKTKALNLKTNIITTKIFLKSLK